VHATSVPLEAGPYWQLSRPQHPTHHASSTIRGIFAADVTTATPYLIQLSLQPLCLGGLRRQLGLELLDVPRAPLRQGLVYGSLLDGLVYFGLRVRQERVLDGTISGHARHHNAPRPHRNTATTGFAQSSHCHRPVYPLPPACRLQAAEAVGTTKCESRTAAISFQRQLPQCRNRYNLRSS
jgi:hypothetical protein